MTKKSVAPERALIETLAAAPLVLRDLLTSIPPDRLSLRRKPHFWTIAQHVAHLVEVQPMLTHRLERFRDEPAPNFTPYRPTDGGSDGEQQNETKSLEAALAQFARFREEQITLINSLPPSVWERKAIHPEFDSYTPAILVRHIAMHDHWHMYRMEELWITKDEFLTDVQ